MHTTAKTYVIPGMLPLLSMAKAAETCGYSKEEALLALANG